MKPRPPRPVAGKSQPHSRPTIHPPRDSPVLAIAAGIVGALSALAIVAAALILPTL